MLLPRKWRKHFAVDDIRSRSEKNIESTLRAISSEMVGQRFGLRPGFRDVTNTTDESTTKVGEDINYYTTFERTLD
jgi:hypothetical protein